MPLKFEITGDNKNLLDSLDGAKAGVKKASKEIEESGLGIEEMFKRVAAAAGIAFSAQQAKQLVGSIMDVRGQFQQLEIAFTTMLQSEEKAKDLMGQLVETAAKTPFDLKGVSEGAKQLLAYGIAAEDVNETITRLGDIAAGLSINLGDLVYLYGTTMTQGRMFTMDLRQFMGRGIPMAEELAKQFGVAKNEVADLVTAGKVSADAVKKAIWGMTEEGSKFGGLMAKQSKSITGQISNIEDAIDNMLNKIGTDSEGIINAGLGGVSALVENYEAVGKVILDVIAVYGVYKGALLATIAIEKILSLSRLAHMKQMTLLQLATDILAKKTSVLNSVMMANPYAMLAAIIATMVAAYISFADTTDKAAEAHKRIQKATEDYNAEVAREKAELDDLFNELREAKEGTDEYEEAKQNILDQYGDYLNGLSDEIKSLQDVEGAYNALTEAINKSARARAMSSATQNAYDAYGTDFGSSSNKLYEALEEKVGARKAQRYIEKVRKELDKTGKISTELRNEIKENFRGTFTYGNSDAWLTGMQNATANLHQEINEAKAAFGELKDETKKEEKKEEAKTYTPGQIKAQLKADLDKAKKALNDFDKSSGKYTLEEAEKKRKELSEAVDLAEKKYKEYGGKDDKPSGSSSSKTDQTSQELASLKETQKNIEIERKRSAEDIEARIAEATIAASRDGAERVRQEREQQNKAELDAIDRQKEDAIRKYVEDEKRVFDQQEKIKKSQNAKYKVRQFDEASVDTSSIAKQYDELKSLTQKRQIQDYAKEQADSLNAYLAEYGTFEQRKLAITKQYEEQINAATTAGEKASLMMRRDAELQQLGNDSLEKRMDWSGVFGELSGHTKEYLQGLRDQLQGIMNEGNLPVDQMAVVSDKIREIDGYLAQHTDLWNFIGDKAREHSRLIQEAADAQDRLNVAKQEEQAATENLVGIQQMIANILGGDASNVSSSELLKSLDAESGAYQVLLPLVTQLSVAEGKLADARKKTTKATNEAKNAEDKSKRESTTAIADWFSDAQQFISEKGIDQIPDLLSSVGLDGAGEKASQGLSAFSNAAGAAADFASGNYIGAALKGISAIKDFGHVLGIGGGNEAEVAETTERLTKANEVLADRISDLMDAIGNSAGLKAIFAYETALEAQQEINQNQMEILKAQMGYHSSHHSNAYYSDDEVIASYNEAVQRAFKAAGVSASTLTGLESIYNLTPEQLKAIKDFAPELWQYLTEVGKYDKSEYWEAVVDNAGKTEELTEQINNNLTQTSFEDLRSNFLDALTDMESDSKDFSRSFEEMMFKAIMNSMVLNDEFDDWLQNWQKQYAQAVKNNDLAALERLRGEAVAMRDQKTSERDMYAQSMGFNGSDYSQEASSKGFQSMGQDTGEELNGRFTALQIAGESVATQAIQIYSQMLQMSSINVSSNTYLSEIRNMMLIANSYLEDVAKYNKKMYLEFSDKLNDLIENTKNM